MELSCLPLPLLLSVLCAFAAAKSLEAGPSAVASPSIQHTAAKRSLSPILLEEDALEPNNIVPVDLPEEDKRGSLLRFGKRRSLFRFGKRGSLFRFGKRGSLLRFGKRRSLFRFGRSGNSDAEFDDLTDKRSSLFRFGKRNVDGFHWGADE